MKTRTVLLADDHAVFLEGLRKILEPEFQVISAVRDGRKMVAEALRLKPDIVVADITMPLLNGIEAMRRIKKTDNKAKVMFLTMHSDPIYAAEALEAGASGYLLKQCAAREVVKAIQTVLKGRLYVSLAISERALDSLRKNSRH